MNKRKIKAMETQKKLLEKSKELIIRKGYENVSISEICKACNVSKGSFYTYFTSKAEIVMQILSDVNDNMFSEQVQNTTASASMQIMDYVKVYMEEIMRQGVDFTRVFLIVLIQEQLPTDSVKAYLHEERVFQIIESGKERGEFRKDLSTESLYQYLSMYIFGLMMHWCTMNGAYNMVEEGEKAVTAFLNILRD